MNILNHKYLRSDYLKNCYIFSRSFQSVKAKEEILQKMMDSSEDDSDFELINAIRAPKARKFNKRVNFSEELDDQEFMRRCRMGKHTIAHICNRSLSN